MSARRDTEIGRVPAAGDLDLTGLDLTEPQLDILLKVDREVWREEAALIGPAYERFGDHLPQALWQERDALLARLEAA